MQSAGTAGILTADLKKKTADHTKEKSRLPLFAVCLITLSYGSSGNGTAENHQGILITEVMVRLSPGRRIFSVVSGSSVEAELRPHQHRKPALSPRGRSSIAICISCPSYSAHSLAEPPEQRCGNTAPDNLPGTAAPDVKIRLSALAGLRNTNFPAVPSSSIRQKELNAFPVFHDAPSRG